MLVRGNCERENGIEYRWTYRRRMLAGHSSTFSACRIGRIRCHAEPCTRIIVIKDFVGAYKNTPQEPDLSIQRGAKDFSPLQKEIPDGPTLRSPSKTVGSIVRGFKIGVGDWFRKNTDMSSIWQRNYYEHIIRNESELKQTRQYIRDNPAEWLEDEENLERIGRGV